MTKIDAELALELANEALERMINSDQEHGAKMIIETIKGMIKGQKELDKVSSDVDQVINQKIND